MADEGGLGGNNLYSGMAEEEVNVMSICEAAVLFEHKINSAPEKAQEIATEYVGRGQFVSS
jgi:hypothetical protein